MELEINFGEPILPQIEELNLKLENCEEYENIRKAILTLYDGGFITQKMTIRAINLLYDALVNDIKEV